MLKRLRKYFMALLTYFDLRQLAYRLAVAKNVRVPESWTTKELAGEDWLKNFMKRRTDLSLSMPIATSIQRMAYFNPHNVNIFMDNLQEVLNRHNYGPSEIWNVDETGLTTVQTTQKVVAEKGSKHVGSAVSQERGKLVTLCCAANTLAGMGRIDTKKFFFNFIFVKTCLELRNYFAAVTKVTYARIKRYGKIIAISISKRTMLKILKL